ncbi:ORF67 [Ranid herpesvirus 1]|uniref:ORF67 n=1 Tax=Ranid herpesvirus 1 TaxID=85655 RepID=Q9YR01_9VIRU|nr:ORF67 [Ranid herpesvirus 1]AAD12264.2 ORF67 [Ranid herpesvirus 1]
MYLIVVILAVVGAEKYALWDPCPACPTPGRVAPVYPLPQHSYAHSGYQIQYGRSRIKGAMLREMTPHRNHLLNSVIYADMWDEDVHVYYSIDEMGSYDDQYRVEDVQPWYGGVRCPLEYFGVCEAVPTALAAWPRPAPDPLMPYLTETQKSAVQSFKKTLQAVELAAPLGGIARMASKIMFEEQNPGMSSCVQDVPLGYVVCTQEITEPVVLLRRTLVRVPKIVPDATALALCPTPGSARFMDCMTTVTTTFDPRRGVEDMARHPCNVQAQRGTLCKYLNTKISFVDTVVVACRHLKCGPLDTQVAPLLAEIDWSFAFQCALPLTNPARNLSAAHYAHGLLDSALRLVSLLGSNKLTPVYRVFGTLAVTNWRMQPSFGILGSLCFTTRRLCYSRGSELSLLFDQLTGLRATRAALETTRTDWQDAESYLFKLIERLHVVPGGCHYIVDSAAKSPFTSYSPQAAAQCWALGLISDSVVLDILERSRIGSMMTRDTEMQMQTYEELLDDRGYIGRTAFACLLRGATTTPQQHLAFHRSMGSVGMITADNIITHREYIVYANVLGGHFHAFLRAVLRPDTYPLTEHTMRIDKSNTNHPDCGHAVVTPYLSFSMHNTTVLQTRLDCRRRLATLSNMSNTTCVRDARWINSFACLYTGDVFGYLLSTSGIYSFLDLPDPHGAVVQGLGRSVYGVGYMLHNGVVASYAAPRTNLTAAAHARSPTVVPVEEQAAWTGCLAYMWPNDTNVVLPKDPHTCGESNVEGSFVLMRDMVWRKAF